MKFAEGKFQAELNEIEKLLKKIDFYEERNYYPNTDFDAAVYRSKNHLDNWKSLISENIYDFILADNSILHFKLNQAESKISFSFYECPFICQTYNEYLEENDVEEEYQEKMFLDYYEIYLHQCPLKEHPIIIRYDFDDASYFEGLHPVSHIHIGNKNQVRIGIPKIFSPKAFVNFIIRQHYPAHWKGMIAKDDDWIKSYLKEKSTLESIETKFWNNLDYAEFHLY